MILSLVKKDGFRYFLLILSGVLFPAIVSVILHLFNLGFIAFYYDTVCFAISGWVLFSFFHYREIRQEEFYNLLLAAFKSQKPLIPMLDAYVNDRPKGYLREFFIAIFLSCLNPCYYFICYRMWRFDRKVVAFSALLAQGLSISEALKIKKGLVSQEVLVAISLGESCGNLHSCLASVSRWHKDLFWLGVLPRLAYLFYISLFIISVLVFFMIFIAPRYQRIYQDFKLPLPWVTQFLFDVFKWVSTFGYQNDWVTSLSGLVWFFLFLLVIFLVLLPFFNSSVRWYTPLVGRIYRIHMQGNFLKMLGTTLRNQAIISQALSSLEECGCFSGPAQSQLRKLNSAVKLGNSLEDSLFESGWMPASMKAFIESSQKVNNLPWALSEIGNQRLRLASLLSQSFSLVVFPLAVFAMGAIVGFIAVGMFMPLINMIVELS